MIQQLKFALFIAVCAVCTACVASQVTEVPQNRLADAVRDCNGSTVGLELAGVPGHYAAVAVGGGYLITDAYVPLRRAEAIYASILLPESEQRIPLKIVKIDEGSGLALLKSDRMPICDAVLADMSEVRVGDPADLAPFQPGSNMGSVFAPYHPFNRPGQLNDVMRLSPQFRPVVPGAGIYGANNALIGVKVGAAPGSSEHVLALPADRIARFLDKHGAPYKQLNASLTVEEY